VALVASICWATASTAAGITTPIRKTRGEDIMAACGQLKSLSELKKGQKVKLD
jgi:adenine C2-methylase RlmN of 23S rRNA A2503 and tRNA A37